MINRSAHAYLIEDRGAYFGVDSEIICLCLQSAFKEERKLYAISDDELVLITR
jgi:hypothetical protein